MTPQTIAADCEHWRDHVIVCGLEEVGLRTVEQLRDAGSRWWSTAP